MYQAFETHQAVSLLHQLCEVGSVPMPISQMETKDVWKFEPGWSGFRVQHLSCCVNSAKTRVLFKL